MSVVSSESCYTCTKCGDEFETGYQRGKMKAGNMPSHLSKVCGEMFPERYQLRDHSHEHSDTWPYRCSFCWKGFLSFHVGKHLKQLNTIRKISCHKCLETFKGKICYNMLSTKNSHCENCSSRPSPIEYVTS
ncbi:hypothetical protein TNCT_607221 [Trichonephila clavata]|uniref:C2H2-type domain-containing protein n=1 Tax=Trichonephila clavata TaxID=2740835 RepID=A0A8X6LW10_TRICU|nr:hypothetical protein TNCT_607221 [Trichonephila clavata]